jgi:tRNA(Ile)-lysidine synthetase-like protein
LRVMEILRAESEFTNEAAAAWVGGGSKDSEGGFAKLPIAVQRRCVQAQLLGHGVPADFALVERLRTSPGKPFMIVPQVAVVCDPNGQLHFQNYAVVAFKPGRFEIELAGGAGEAVFDGRRIGWAVRGRKSVGRPGREPGKEWFDADKVGPRIVLRHWQPGDRFQPIGMSQPVKLQDLFVNQKIPRERRHDLIVAVTGGNEVFWVENLRISERFKLTPRTTRQLIWQWK